MTRSDAVTFEASLGCLISPALNELATQLVSVAGLHARERDVVLGATREALSRVLYSKLSRLLVLELNAARVTGRLTGEDPKKRWEQFLEISSEQPFWDDLAVHYPSLLPRIGAILRHRCRASLQFAQRWALDRQHLSGLCGGEPGELLELRFGAGDSHRAGQTVAILRSEAGQIVYKPRSLAIDIALRGFIAELAADHRGPLVIRVPEAVGFDDHGWVEFIPHRYAAGPEELREFYRGIGHWLALMRLLGGRDLHAENMIAHGESPVVVDCETLFTPKVAPFPSDYGQAVDRAAELVGGTVLNVGLLPNRGASLGWRGVDNSAVGMLPGEQPVMRQPGIVQVGSDEARIGATVVETGGVSPNHPSPQPALAEYWPYVLEGFDGMTDTLRRLDAAGVLRARLDAFAPCRIRVVPRASEVYAEIGRMLWHPVSLHKQEPARQRGFDLLKRMATNVSSAPGDPAVIDAEINDLMEGDIPVFSTLVKDGRLEGPGSTHWLPQCNLIDSTLNHWRAADFELERNMIRASLVSAYINDGWMPKQEPALLATRRGGDFDARRRQQAAKIVRGIVANAILGDDGTAQWIAPVLNQTGWSVQLLQQDVYNGISGLALLAGAYLRETSAGRADPVEGLEDLFAGMLRTLRLSEGKDKKMRQEGLKIRPPPPGGYIGVASQIWAHLVLADWGLDGGDGLERACTLAEIVPEAVALDETCDVLAGAAGAIVPLLALARRTREERYLRMASQLGDRLCERAQRKGDGAFWVHPSGPEGIGGFAHGVTGIGWALSKLAAEAGVDRHQQTAQAAFAFEDALFDEEEQNWLDLRMLPGAKTATAWCHGSVGIGLARLDLDPTLANPATRQVLRRAAAATWRLAFGWNHCACHGDFGAWELLERAITMGEGPKDLTLLHLDESLLSSLEDHGPSCGMLRDAFAPGLLPGLGGIAYQLLRMHPENGLPSILIPGGSGPPRE
ncbi:MAG TPA: type 2 lanthipeptide synthetase LanM family protein [Chthoniobacterales bacterium]|nr:type 2 lanthipeptide synthetase LanM family protein [Chthoniobacterales bacterium]